MTERYVLIRYRDSANVERVGSGYIVRGSTVLTANHVADGTGHRVECDDRAEPYPVDPAKTLLSGTEDVDLGVLQLAGNPLRLAQLSFAQVDRGGMMISDCMAIGFPRWTAHERDRQYEVKQIEGFVRTADRVRMGRPGGAGGQLLRLGITWQPDDERPPVPYGQLDGKPGNAWGGMSGAAVTVRDPDHPDHPDRPVVIGVIHSHNYVRNPNVLTATPLLALKLLPEETLRKFCDALGIPDLDGLPMARGRELSRLPGGAGPGQPYQPAGPASATPEFSDGIRDDFRQKLRDLGVPAPSAWNCAALRRFYDGCRDRAELPDADANQRWARDLAKALWQAAAALPLLSRFGGQYADIRKLQYLYHRHVGREPKYETLDGMLIDAADAGIGEDYDALKGRGQPGGQTVTALARFMLGIASHWWARRGAATTAELGELNSWMWDHLRISESDVERYLGGIGERVLAVIEFETEDLGTNAEDSVRDMPTAIVFQTVSDAGEIMTDRVECEPAPTSERDVAKFLRDWVNSWLYGADFIVEFFLPRDWFGARVEHWPLLDVAGSAEPLSKDHDPHLRWVKHRRDGVLAGRLKERYDKMSWMDNPEDIPPHVTNDPARLKAWLDGRDSPLTQDPPYFIGSSHGARDHDPLAGLLREGYGFITWFTAEATSGIRDAAKGVADDFRTAWQRKDDLPRKLAKSLQQHEPIIIWSEPGRREDFDIPPTTFTGPRRSGRNRP